jgi:type VI secretion system Hcp family effector
VAVAIPAHVHLPEIGTFEALAFTYDGSRHATTASAQKLIDELSPKLAQAMANNRTFRQVVVTFRRENLAGPRLNEIYHVMRLQQARISSITWRSPDSADPGNQLPEVEAIGFVFLQAIQEPAS